MRDTNRSNPYQTHPDELQAPLSDPEINRFEHEVAWPRFQVMLPRKAHRVLDFGCGPGNFTEQLAERYVQSRRSSLHHPEPSKYE
jgi:2-polyprenyl-3-methyl-5-hydroxy-6-metoxy-1,4-benzoquinol methylase